MAPIPRLRDYQGPAILSYGFRPFFLAGSLYAGFAILIWLPQFYGELTLPTAFAPLDWHIHEMLFGYLAAIITGFLLTAVPNWTGRLPLQGKPLLGLLALWLAGRLAVMFSAAIGWLAAALVDVAFLATVFAVAAREIAAGRNWPNLKVLIPVGALLAANVTFHVEAHWLGSADLGKRAGIVAAVALVILVGGRIVPSFTRNWLARENPGRLPAPIDRLDVALVIAGLIALLTWIFAPEAVVTSAAMMLAALAQSFRLARWVGWRAWRDPLILILHLAYAFVPAGFALLALSSDPLDLVPASAGIHAFTAGAFGAMTLAVMTRASLGHTGRRLHAGPGTVAIYLAVLVAASARIAAALEPSIATGLLCIAGLSWVAAFLGFGLLYGPIVIAPRPNAIS